MRHFNKTGDHMSGRNTARKNRGSEVVGNQDNPERHTVDFADLRTVKQLASMNTAFSEASLRWLLFNAEKNGLNRALVKLGSRVLIDVPIFERWLEAQRVAQIDPVEDRGDDRVAAR